MLHEFVSACREEIITRSREKLTNRPWPLASTSELANGVPLFLDQLSRAVVAGIQRVAGGARLRGRLPGADARKAVEAHGGSIHRRNVPGRGCVFVVDLPLAIDDLPAVAASA